MKKKNYLEAKKASVVKSPNAFEPAISHIYTPHEHFCAKLLSDYKDFDPEIFSCTTTCRSALKDILAL